MRHEAPNASSSSSSSLSSASGGDGDIPADLASLFECPVCFDYVLPPILQCQSSHLGCSSCHSKLTCCTTGRGSLGNVRNFAMEKNWPFPRQYFQRLTGLRDSSKKLKLQIWSSVVTILLVEAKNLLENSDTLFASEPYIKFRLGNEKYKSKTSYRARWLEQFDLHLYDEDQILEVSIWCRNNMLSRCTLDLSTLPWETTHSIWLQFENNESKVLLMLTISGTTASEAITDLTSYKDNAKEQKAIIQRYSWLNTFHKLRDVGHLMVKVYGATGLAAADIGGKSDPFCVLELDNSRLQTQTEYKTLTPNWNKIFTFNIKDMTSVLEVTVFDEDRDHKVEFLGKIAIPLFKIRNGVKHWYALKDKKLLNRAKGSSPKILLEMNAIWNPIRAAVRISQPREEKLAHQDPKFKKQIFLQNVSRLRELIMDIIQIGRFIKFNSC